MNFTSFFVFSALFYSLFSALAIQVARAEMITCMGRTSDPHTTVMDFQIDLSGKKDQVTGQIFYKSLITYTLPDGSKLKQGIDLNDQVRKKLDKIIYTGTNIENHLELAFDNDGSLKSAILNQPLKGMNQLPVHCDIDGTLPVRPVCSTEIDKNIPLLEALKSSQDLDQIETAISCGAQINKADKNGCTPLMIAIEPNCGVPGNPYYPPVFNDPPHVLDFLLENGAFVSIADQRGETPLIKAAKYGLRDVYKSFIAAEADFDAQDRLGFTPLMYAAYNGDFWVTKQILEGNPNRRLKNHEGKTAYDIAKQWQHLEILDLVKIPDETLAIAGQNDGSCSPLQINFKQGQVIEFILKATHQMFKLESKSLELDLMADANSESKQVISLENKGSYSFSCGIHGASQASHGKIVVQ